MKPKQLVKLLMSFQCLLLGDLQLMTHKNMTEDVKNQSNMYAQYLYFEFILIRICNICSIPVFLKRIWQLLQKTKLWLKALYCELGQDLFLAILITAGPSKLYIYQKFRGPSGPQLLVCGPSGLLDFVLCALWALRQCNPHRKIV